MATYGGTPKPEGGFELYSWFFMRVSGLLLILLVLGHFAVMHVINSVDDVTFEFVARRYMTPFWRSYDLLMLTLALFHGFNGARILVDDYVHTRGWRVFTYALIGTLTAIFLVIGGLIIVTFQG